MQNLWIFIPLFALLDRAWGGGLKVKIKGHGLGKPAALLIGPVAYFVQGFSVMGAVLLMLAFFIGRSPAWKVFGGSLVPTVKQLPGTFARHALTSGAFLVALAITFQETGFDKQRLWLLPYSVAATALAYDYARMETARAEQYAETGVLEPDKNWLIELLRGASLGLCLFLALV